MARVVARTRKQVIEIVCLTRHEVLTWLPEHVKKAYSGLRALHCPQCHATCQQLYLVPWRSLIFLCWECAQLLKKQKPMAVSSPDEPISNPALAALLDEHARTIRPTKDDNEQAK